MSKYLPCNLYNLFINNIWIGIVIKYFNWQSVSWCYLSNRESFSMYYDVIDPLLVVTKKPMVAPC